MDFDIKVGRPEKQRSACLIVGIFTQGRLSADAKAIDVATARRLSTLIKRGDIEGEIGQTLILHDLPGVVADRVLLVGCGRAQDINDNKYRQIIGHSIRALETTGATNAYSYLTALTVKWRDMRWNIAQAATVALESIYEFNEFKSKQKKAPRVISKISLHIKDKNKGDMAAAKKALRLAQATCGGVAMTMDLANKPANICTPSYLAKQAHDLGKNCAAMKVTVLDEEKLEKLGMGALLAVSSGSHEPAKLITVEYNGAAKKDDKPVVLVGKGVTFDTGGISIKPASAMDEMKFDMCGAASVFGVLHAVAALELPINLVGVIPATENMPGGKAIKPGDIVTSYSGQTIEILNTDAEGRLILCDALSYSKKFNPDVVIDIATLTGACVVSLGQHASGLLSNHQPLAKALLKAGDYAFDRAWQLPLWQDYQEQLKSNFADMANIGGREAGTITAACFLARFTEKYHWAHLDIAGTAWRSGRAKGATGRPVRLIMQYLLDRIDVQ